MRNSFIYFLLIVSLATCTEKRRVPDGTYEAYFYDTMWTLEITNEAFTYTSSGHLGTDRFTIGTYEIAGDTLILHSDSLDHYNKFLIDGDSCLIEVEIQTDYCITRSDEWGSRWRNINYPQIKVADPNTKERVIWMLETTLNGDKILEYFPNSTKRLVIQTYFELNKQADLNLKSHGRAVTFLTEREIEENEITEYLIIDDIRLGVETGMVDLQVMPEFSTSILEFFKKENGQWMHQRR
jgi:hypothetical protein